MRPVDLLERLGRPPAVAALDGEEAVYVVGGAVRDLLLGREPRELDFVVEGDAVAVARRTGGRVIAHERFGTATVLLPGATFDLTSARSERYERPGALPTVELGASLREDLERRDVTVNAIALHLADGELTWHPLAREDLEARRLRVLHDGSFLDDPTRLLRLARYSARLGFEPEERTDRLAAEAIAGGALRTVTGSRLGAELRLLLREPQPAALLALERNGLGRALLGDAFAPDEQTIATAHELWPGGLAALAASLGGRHDAAGGGDPAGGGRAEIARMLDRLAFPAHDRDVVARAAAVEPAAGGTDLELWERFRREPAEAVAVAGARGDAGAARRWLDDVRHRRLAIDGNDIVAAGLSGPAVGEALDRAQRAMLEGRAPSREEQLAAALG
jgi:tRNA nucleotidyltransferase (CCA-adding enzyme)